MNKKIHLRIKGSTKKMESFIECSIIIPNLHSPIIDKTIHSLLIQEKAPPFEIIVVGMDKFEKINAFKDSVTFLETELPTPPAIARNMGVSIAKGELIFFIDADCIAKPDWILQHIKVHEKSPKHIVVGGGVTFPYKNFLTIVDNVSSFHEFMSHIPPGEKDYLPSLNLSIPRHIWEETGGFNTKYPSGEDIELTLRIKKKGFQLIFAPEAKIIHRPNRNSITKIIHHGFRFGKYSIKANSNFHDMLYIPFPFRHWFLTVVFSPFLAAGVIFKMVFQELLPIKYWPTLPFIYFIKITWCLGFASQIRKTRN